MKRKVPYGILLGLTILVISGCGKKENNADEGSIPEVSSGVEEASGEDIAMAEARREPPVMELHPVSEEGDSLSVSACGYQWNWPEGADQMGAAIADSAAPLSEGAPWNVLTLSENGGDTAEYSLAIEGKPDELGINMWNLSDIGNADAESSRTSVYQGAEIAAGDFTIELQAGKVYEIWVEWKEEKVAENGCFGTAYYVFKTVWPVWEGTEEASDGLTGTDNEADPDAGKEEKFPEATFGEADEEEVDSLDGITMRVIQVSPEGARLEILNQTDQEVTFGEDYELQVWRGEGWHRVNYIIDNAAFTMVGYMAGNGESCLFDVEWTWFHGILPEGRYRMTKTVSVQEGENSVNYRLAAEFEISASGA